MRFPSSLRTCRLSRSVALQQKYWHAVVPGCSVKRIGHTGRFLFDFERDTVVFVFPGIREECYGKEWNGWLRETGFLRQKVRMDRGVVEVCPQLSGDLDE